MFNLRKFVAILGLAAVLLTVLTPFSTDLIWAVLTPVLSFVALILVIQMHSGREYPEILPVPFLSLTGPRAPPSR